MTPLPENLSWRGAPLSFYLLRLLVFDWHCRLVSVVGSFGWCCGVSLLFLFWCVHWVSRLGLLEYSVRVGVCLGSLCARVQVQALCVWEAGLRLESPPCPIELLLGTVSHRRCSPSESSSKKMFINLIFSQAPWIHLLRSYHVRVWEIALS